MILCFIICLSVNIMYSMHSICTLQASRTRIWGCCCGHWSFPSAHQLTTLLELADLITVATIESSSVKGGGFIKGGMRRHLSNNFSQCRSWKRNQDLSIVSNVDGDTQNATVNNIENAHAAIAIDPTVKEAVGSGRCMKTAAQPITPLCKLHPMLVRNSMKKLNDVVTVYGAVLGFTPPSLTGAQEWKMSIEVIHETLQLSDWVRGGQLDMRNSTNCNKLLEMHVPSITLMLFTKEKSKLLVIQTTGDVICCEKVVLQA